MMEKGTKVHRSSERYAAPTVKVITVKVNHVLCSSERQNALNGTEMEEGDDNW